MAHDSMVRTLMHQAEALWPQEEPLFRAHARDGAPRRVLDAGCGTGEVASRLARLWPQASITGVDLIESHLDLARARYPDLAGRMDLRTADILDLPFDDVSFDLTVCRHVLQAVPDASRALTELVRVTRPGGRLHLIAEDYGMIWTHPGRLDSQVFWREGPAKFGQATGCDLFVGRHVYTLLHAQPVRDVAMHYLAVDTLRVRRETVAGILEAWKEGYREAIAQYSSFTLEEVDAYFDDMIGCIQRPDGFALWLVPLATATRS